MNTLFIKTTLNIIDTTTLLFHGLISPDNFSTNLWEEDILNLSFINNKLQFTNLYSTPFSNYLNYSHIEFTLIDSLGDTKVKEVKNIYDLLSLNSILNELSIENDDILEITLTSYLLEKDTEKHIKEKTEKTSIFFIFKDDSILPLSYSDYEELKRNIENLSSKEKEVSVSLCTNTISNDSFLNEPISLSKVFITSKTIIPLDFYKSGYIHLHIFSLFSNAFSLYLLNTDGVTYINTFTFNEDCTVFLPSNGCLLIETSTTKPLHIKLKPIDTKYKEIKTLVFSKNNFFLEGLSTASSSTTQIVKTDYLNLVILNSNDFNITSDTLTDLIQLALYNKLLISKEEQ